ncbi:MAG: hypothetical protein FJZ78_07000 [Bacteroidetes bacterium]|nr:hypothetical protein [Bacteroidota bacterium]
MTERLNLWISLGAAVWFMGLITISELSIEMVWISVVTELFTIPIALVTLLNFFLSYRNWKRRGFIPSSDALRALVVSLFIGLLLFVFA